MRLDTYAPLFIVEVDGKQLPEDISQHIEDFSYDDHEDKMDELKIRIANADLSFVDHPQLQEGKEIRARWGYIGNLSEMRICTIKEIGYDFAGDGLLRMDLSAFDKRHKLTGRAPRTCWNNKKVENIVCDIAKKHNLKPVVEIPDDLVREYTSQGGRNDMVFLKELAIDCGCVMWVRNDELHFEPNKVTPPVMKFRWREDRDGYLQSFKIKSNAEDGKGTGCETEKAGIDPRAKKEIKETTTAPELGLRTNLNTGATENETPHQKKDDESGHIKPTPAPTKTLAKQEGKGLVQTGAMKAVEATATTIGLPALRAKDSITVENIGKKFSGNWRIKKVKHRLSRNGYTCELELVKSDHEGKGNGAAKTNNTGSTTPAGESKNTTPPPVEVKVG